MVAVVASFVRGGAKFEVGVTCVFCRISRVFDSSHHSHYRASFSTLSTTTATLSSVLSSNPSTTPTAGGLNHRSVMALTVAGVGLLSLKSPFSHLYPFIVANTDIQSLFCFIVFLLVVFIIGKLSLVVFQAISSSSCSSDPSAIHN